MYQDAVKNRGSKNRKRLPIGQPRKGGRAAQSADETMLLMIAAVLEDCLRTAKDDCVAMIVASQDEEHFNGGLEAGETSMLSKLMIRVFGMPSSGGAVVCLR